MTHPTLLLTKQLISCPSVTPEDAGCQNLIKDYLERLGFVCESISTNTVSNLWAKKGQTQPLVLFAGHTDVVPTGPMDQWLFDPFSPTEHEGKLYGRGAADMKSSLAAMLVATEEFISMHPTHRGAIGFLITSDEEGPATDGTRYVCNILQTRGEAIRYCIVGEPTSEHDLGDTIKNGRRGSMSGRLTIHGVQGHIAYPHLANNPIHLALPALTQLTQTIWDDGNMYYSPTSLQLSNIRAGTGASNVIPGTLEVDFNFRFSTESSVSHLQKRVSDILDQHLLPYELTWTISGEPFLTPKGVLSEAISQAIFKETGRITKLSTTGGTSDGRFIAKICPEVIECGPINASIHKINEHILLNDLLHLKNIYRRILENLLLN